MKYFIIHVLGQYPYQVNDFAAPKDSLIQINGGRTMMVFTNWWKKQSDSLGLIIERNFAGLLLHRIFTGRLVGCYL